MSLSRISSNSFLHCGYKKWPIIAKEHGEREKRLFRAKPLIVFIKGLLSFWLYFYYIIKRG